MDDDQSLVGTRIGRLIVIASGAIGLWASLAITIANIMASSAPTTVLLVWPWSSSARAALAAQQVNTGRMLTRSEASQMAIEAREASHRSIVNVVAAHSYGVSMLYLGKPNAARAAIAFSEVLSRRNLATQLWLIEDAVSTGNVTGALIHYDRALRVSIKARALLFPILVAAAEQPQIRKALAGTLSRRPSWWAAFISQEIGQASTPEALVPLVLSLRLDGSDPSQAQIIGAALDRLASWGRFEEAWRLQRQYQLGGMSVPGVVDGGFERPKDFGPFAWRLSDTGDPTATIEMRGRGHALFLSAQSQSGEVARQVVKLAPGNNALSIRAGGFHGDESATIDLRCATNDDHFLHKAIAPTADDGVATSFPFMADEACPFALLTVNYQGDGQSGNAWLDDIQIKRASQ